MRQHATPTEYDRLRVLHVNFITPGTWMRRRNARITLHYADDPCHNAERLSDPMKLELGRDVPPRPEFRRFCEVCDWPASRKKLRETLCTIPVQYR